MEHLLTSEEVAEILHVDPVTIRRLVNKGDLSAYRVGADYRFAPTDLEDYLLRQRISASAANMAESAADSPLDAFTQLLRKALKAKHTTPFELVTRDRFDRFTRRARTVLTLAEEEARAFQHNYIGTEHLLLGLVKEGEGVAARVLANLGVDLQQVRSGVEFIIGRGERIVLGEVGLTPRAKRVIELAVDEARRLNHNFVGTEHLLLGLIREGEGIAAGVLENLGVNLLRARAETMEVLRRFQESDGADAGASVKAAPPEAAALLGAGEQGLACARCEARSPVYFRFCFNCGQRLAQEERSAPSGT
jgi:excisionase family DNA binding protein